MEISRSQEYKLAFPTLTCGIELPTDCEIKSMNVYNDKCYLELWHASFVNLPEECWQKSYKLELGFVYASKVEVLSPEEILKGFTEVFERFRDRKEELKCTPQASTNPIPV